MPVKISTLMTVLPATTLLAANRPFFLYYALNSPHNPFSPYEKDLYEKNSN